jgi:hypothetical protein
VSSLTTDKFDRHKLSCILYSRFHGTDFVNSSWDTFCVLAVMRRVLSTQVEMLVYCSLAEEGLANSGEAVFCVLTWMVWVGLTQVHIYFVSSLGLEVFGQHMLRCILCPRWLGMDLDNPSWIVLSVQDGMGGFWSRQVEINSVPMLGWDRFHQHKLICILCPG